MCGIVGLMNYSARGGSAWTYKIFLNLLYADALRGMHGTGMFAVDLDGNMSRVKVGGPPNQLFNTKEFETMEKFVRSNEIRFLVGHNRFATKGKKTTAHAHPFRDGHITLVHNGTLENYRHLPDHSKYEVDSELLCHSIAVDGIDKTIQGLEGAWTIVYWDSKEKTLNFLRNEERPLAMAWHKGEKMFAFASEKEMLESIMTRNGYYAYEINEVPEDTLLSFSLDGKGEDTKPHLRELKGKPVKKVPYTALFDFDNANDACDTSETASCDTNIVKPRLVPVVTSASGNGEWSRGKTGTVRTHRTSKNDTGKVRMSWTSAEHLHDLSKGMWITAAVIDYDLIEGTTDMYQFTCIINEYPDIEFKCNVKGDKPAEILMEARYGIRGQIFQIMKSTQPPAVCPHRIYLNNPSPAYNEEPKEIPNHALN
jgi:hypothetical protein